MIDKNDIRFKVVLGEGIVPSKVQVELCDFIAHKIGNAIVESRAGSGKSKTIELMAHFVPKGKKSLIVCFNTHIAEHLKNELSQQEVNADVMTYHSLGYKILLSKKVISGNNKFKDDKYRNFIINNINTINPKYEQLNNIEKNFYKKNILKLIDYSRYNLMQSEKEIRKIANKYGINCVDNECEAVKNILRWGSNNFNEFDYQDMIWLPYELGINANIPWLQYDYIFVDEAQDSSLAQQNLINICSKRTTRLIIVGDSKQCQPAGTKISLANGEIKNIEDIVIGDKVITYNQGSSGHYTYYKNGSKHGFKVTNISERYVDKTVKITTENGLSSEYSYNHICYAKFNREKCYGKYVLYLMVNEDGMWRIGKTQLFKNNNGKKGKSGSFGLTIRTTYESCNKAYILDIYNTNKEATLMEGLISAKFGIPQVVFNTERTFTNKFSNKEIKEYYFKYIGNIEDRVIACLEYFNKDINCPFVEKYSDVKHSRDHMFTIYACNLFPNIMSVNYLDKNNIGYSIKNGTKIKFYKYSYTPINKIEYIFEHKKVYSIEVEKYHNYLADGILTHNCINSWAGSDEEAFNNFRKKGNMKEFVLSTSYRCSRKIAELAKMYVPDFNVPEWASEGEVNYDVSLDNIRPGDMVLCRLTSPLVDLHLRLISNKLPSKIKGLELGEELKSILNTYKTNDITELRCEMEKDLVNKWINISKENEISLKEAACENDIMILYDTLLTLNIISKGLSTKKEVIERIDSVIGSEDENMEDTDNIHLTTIHKAKGLENERVFILCPSLMPSRLAHKDWEIKSEQNLIYVAYTRAKKSLNFLSEKEFPPSVSYSGVDNMYNTLMKLKEKYGN